MLKNIHKKIVMDENNNPSEVIIKYKEWKEIEQILKSYQKKMTKGKLIKYLGIINIKEDPMDFQRKIRSEWR